ncbi:MAG: tail fiber protein [Deltaproteobacteria bacterium]|nr:tail fiber protein [Deltaproteobacteria bacterium]
MRPDPERRWYSVEDVAAWMGSTPDAVRRLLAERGLGVRVGDTLRVPHRALQQLESVGAGLAAVTAQRRPPPRGLGAALAVALTLCAVTLRADVVGDPPVARKIPYQGFLEDAGAPVTGNASITFALYPDTAAGTPLWSETRSVQVFAGRFGVLLGDTTPLPASVAGSRELYLALAVNGQDLVGRQLVFSLPTTSSSANGVPPGSIVAFGGVALPHGWLPCNGAALRSADYPALHGAIGTAWGDGTRNADGSASALPGSDFNLPDLRGRFLRGVDSSAGRDPDAAARQAANAGGNAGDAVGSVQGSATARPVTAFTTSTDGAHTHTYNVSTVDDSNNCCTTTIASQGDTAAVAGSPATSNAGNHGHSISGGGDAETRPRNASVAWAIKY